jgi:uncharacterized protein
VARIRNDSTGVVLAESAAVAKNPWTRFRGLMLRSRLNDGEGLIIKPCGSIHMMFMRFRIDAVFFDKNLQVTRVRRGLRPWAGFAFGGRAARGVVELPAGAASVVEPGHQLAIDA